MKKLLLVSALCLPASAAFATGNGPNPPPFQGGSSASTSAVDFNANLRQTTTVGVRTNVGVHNKNVNNPVAHGGRGGAGGAGGNALSNSTSNATGGQGGDARGASSNTNVSVTGDRDRLQAPALAIPGIAPGNNCALAASMGLSFAGVGGGAAYSWEGQECLLIAWTATMQGDQVLQLAIACQSEIIARAMATAGRTCPGKTPPTAVSIRGNSSNANLTVWRNGVMN